MITADDGIFGNITDRIENHQNSIDLGTFKAEPMCHDMPLNLSLDCEHCEPGFPKVDICVKFGRLLTSDSEFKVRNF